MSGFCRRCGHVQPTSRDGRGRWAIWTEHPFCVGCAKISARRDREKMTETASGAGQLAGTFMAGKRGLIMGVANNRSIAWGIAKAVGGTGRRGRAHLPGRRPEEAGRAARRRAGLEGRPAVRRHRRRLHGRDLRRAGQAWGRRSTFSSTPSPSPTRTSSTAATSTRSAKQLRADHADLLLLAAPRSRSAPRSS